MPLHLCVRGNETVLIISAFNCIAETNGKGLILDKRFNTAPNPDLKADFGISVACHVGDLGVIAGAVSFRIDPRDRNDAPCIKIDFQSVMDAEANAKVALEMIQLYADVNDFNTAVTENRDMRIIGGCFRVRREAHIVHIQLKVTLNGMMCGILRGV